MFLVATNASAEEVRVQIESHGLEELAKSCNARVVETDSLLGIPEAIIAIAALTVQALTFARPICLALIQRNRHVSLKYGDFELSAESPADLERVLLLLEKRRQAGSLEN